MKRPRIWWLAIHDRGMRLSSAAQVGMADICCHASSGHYRTSWETLFRSLGEGAALAGILQMLDEYYGVVMMLVTLSGELCSLKQGPRENVDEFRVCLLQQVQIHQLGYLGRIQ